MEPSDEFGRYAITLAVFEAQRVCGATKHVLELSLWAAAVFDWFRQSGEMVRMIDGLGRPLADARMYEMVIRDALMHYVRAA